MRVTRAGALLVLAACWSSTERAMPAAPAAGPASRPRARPIEHRVIVRIDAQPGGKRFQGVWLEHTDGTRWVIDYRPRQVWTWFRDREVLVTGGCYAPEGQAIMAPHFRVARLRLAAPRPGAWRYLEVGPEVMLRGELVTEASPPGSKRAGATRVVFRADDGEAYHLVGDVPAHGEPVQLRARRLVNDPSFAARDESPDLWVASIHDVDHEPAPPPAAGPCP